MLFGVATPLGLRVMADHPSSELLSEIKDSSSGV